MKWLRHPAFFIKNLIELRHIKNFRNQITILWGRKKRGKLFYIYFSFINSLYSWNCMQFWFNNEIFPFSTCRLNVNMQVRCFFSHLELLVAFFMAKNYEIFFLWIIFITFFYCWMFEDKKKSFYEILYLWQRWTFDYEKNINFLCK